MAVSDKAVYQDADAPNLSATEHREAEESKRPRAAVIHEAVRRGGEEELARTVSSLAWSGIASGLSMGFSLVAEGLLRAYLPETSWRPLIAKLGYPLGFVLVVIGRQQLYTENTLTAVIPFMHAPSRRMAQPCAGRERLIQKPVADEEYEALFASSNSRVI